MSSSVVGTFPRADTLYDRAVGRMPGGNSRTSLFVRPHPPYAVSGAGCRLTDVDEHTVIDLLNNFTSLIHGHAHPKIVAAATDAVANGSAFGLPTEHEVDLAELLAARIPGAESWRFTNSGTEAVMMAVRAARAFTGRDLIVRFEHSYHGTYDGVALDHRGVAEGVAGMAIVLTVADGEALLETLENDGDRIAAVVVDGMPHHAGLVPVPPEFMRLARDVTARCGALLVQDEVISFRAAPGGLQSLYDVVPDITALGKIIGGGFPVGAVGGRADVMEVFNPLTSDPVSHGGTFSANPVTMRAGLTAMEMMTTEEYARINALGERLRSALVAQGWRVNGLGSLLKIDIGTTPETWWQLYEEGLLVSPGGLACISTAMDDSVIDEALASFARAAP
jgi:glutamate-1-semialdehyde 2,1-aminomutase